MFCEMRWSGLHSGGVNGCGRSTWTNRLILIRFGMERAEVMEKMKIKWGGRRGFSTITLLQIYGLKVGMVNPTL